MNTHPVVHGLLVAALMYLLYRIGRRLQLSKAKHPSLRGHARMARRMARFVPFYEYDDGHIFASDDAPAQIVARRNEAFTRLSRTFRQRFKRSAALTQQVEASISDVQFTSAYRVPFQFSRHVREHLAGGNFVEASEGIRVRDLDGNEFIDLTGSYGVNVFGHDFYKECMAAGSERVRELGAVLGPYHPVVAYNVRRLREISGLDEVSFHMSGTEAVMQAVRLARYHTGRTHLVRFCGAYHGWWGDVQPGPGNPQTQRETYTLKDMDDDTLRVLRTRKDIACVLVNPLQSLHPNQNASGDSTLLDSGRDAHPDREAYTRWLQQLREVCTARGIVLIFDEVFVGFRLAARGAQQYFGVEADMVTYGKTLGGGLPIGAVCGRADLMKRFRDDRPADLCFARGTFNSHPHVMASTHEFLRRLETPEMQRQYEGLDEVWDGRCAKLNQCLADAGIPVQLKNVSTIFTVCYTQPSRYNWMLQFYLRAEGLALSWVGTGRLIFSLNFTDGDFEGVTRRFVAAASAMQRDGFWWSSPELTNKAIRRRVLREMLAVRLGSKLPPGTRASTPAVDPLAAQ